jgi:hypothetical protein
MSVSFLPASHAVGDAGHTSDHNLIEDYLQNQALSVHNVLDYGAKGNGTTDDTAAIQAALNACSKNGGIVFIPSIGTFDPDLFGGPAFCVSHLDVYGNTRITGAGRNSVIRAISAPTKTYTTVNGNPVTLAAVIGSYDDTQCGIIIDHINIDGGSVEGVSTTGIYLNGYNSGLATEHHLESVWVYNCAVDGIRMGQSAIENYLAFCFAYNNGNTTNNPANGHGNGFRFDGGTTDSRVVGCCAGQNAGDGFHIMGNNYTFTGCKAYYNGFIDGSSGGQGSSSWYSNGHGYHILADTSISQTESRCISITACEAQNNAVHGFYFDGSASGTWVDHVAINGCISDGNNGYEGSGATGQGAGYAGYNWRDAVISGCASNTQSGFKQAYGISLFGTCTGLEVGVNDFSGGTVSQTNYTGATGYLTVAMTQH